MKNTSNRNDAECQRAIRDFWNAEREHIKNGTGTRDWTYQQQIEIMNFRPSGGEYKNARPATDLNGYAYEGHHMKSVEAHPEYQGRSDNIQALTRDEHRSAHGYKFQYNSNGYYNHETGLTKPFVDVAPTKPDPVRLSESYVETVEYKYIKSGELENQCDRGIG